MPILTRYRNIKGDVDVGVVRGHPESMKIAPFDRAHATFYSSLIETIVYLVPFKVKLHLFDLLWICCGLAGGFRFVVQHLDMSRCCGFVVDARFVVDLLWTCGFVVQLSICCGFVVDLLYSLLYNKSTTNRISGV